MKLTGNTILITGGGTGIGLALAKSFLERDNRVIVCGRRQDKLDAACASTPGLRAYRCDVSDPGERQALLEAIERDGDRVNVLFNNAAVMRTYDLADPEHLDLDKIHDDIRVNFLAPIALTKLFLPMLRHQPDPVIVNVSSPGGIVPLSNVPVYSACKAALHSFTRSLRFQLGDAVEVIELFPPAVDTEIMDKVEIDKISAEACVEESMRRLERGGREIWVGNGRVIPWLHRIAPHWTDVLANRGLTVARDARP